MSQGSASTYPSPGAQGAVRNVRVSPADEREDGRVSLAPLTPEQALRGLLGTKPNAESPKNRRRAGK